MMETTKAPRNLFKLIPWADWPLPAEPSRVELAAADVAMLELLMGAVPLEGDSEFERATDGAVVAAMMVPLRRSDGD